MARERRARASGMTSNRPCPGAWSATLIPRWNWPGPTANASAASSCSATRSRGSSSWRERQPLVAGSVATPGGQALGAAGYYCYPEASRWSAEKVGGHGEEGLQVRGRGSPRWRNRRFTGNYSSEHRCCSKEIKPTNSRGYMCTLMARSGTGPTESQARGSWCGHAGAGFVGTALVLWPSLLPVPI